MSDADDPMAYLNAKREEMAAMTQMAAVAQAQEDLARNVQARMDQIDALMSGDPDAKLSAPPEGDDEVEYWRRKIEELSMPTPRSSDDGVKSLGLIPSNPAEGKLSWEGTSSFAAERNSTTRPHGSTASAAEPKSSLACSHGGYGSTRQSSRGGSSFKSTEPEPVAPSAKLESTVDADAEVDYWRRKIAELSAPSGSGFESAPNAGLNPLTTRLPRQKESLANEPLSWEGTASFADENAKAVSNSSGASEGKDAKE